MRLAVNRFFKQYPGLRHKALQFWCAKSNSSSGKGVTGMRCRVRRTADSHEVTGGVGGACMLRISSSMVCRTLLVVARARMPDMLA